MVRNLACDLTPRAFLDTIFSLCKDLPPPFLDDGASSQEEVQRGLFHRRARAGNPIVGAHVLPKSLSGSPSKATVCSIVVATRKIGYFFEGGPSGFGTVLLELEWGDSVTATAVSSYNAVMPVSAMLDDGAFSCGGRLGTLPIALHALTSVGVKVWSLAELRSERHEGTSLRQRSAVLIGNIPLNLPGISLPLLNIVPTSRMVWVLQSESGEEGSRLLGFPSPHTLDALVGGDFVARQSVLEQHTLLPAAATKGNVYEFLLRCQSTSRSHHEEATGDEQSRCLEGALQAGSGDDIVTLLNRIRCALP